MPSLLKDATAREVRELIGKHRKRPGIRVTPWPKQQDATAQGIVAGMFYIENNNGFNTYDLSDAGTLHDIDMDIAFHGNTVTDSGGRAVAPDNTGVTADFGAGFDRTGQGSEYWQSVLATGLYLVSGQVTLRCTDASFTTTVVRLFLGYKTPSLSSTRYAVTNWIASGSFKTQNVWQTIVMQPRFVKLYGNPKPFHALTADEADQESTHIYFALTRATGNGANFEAKEASGGNDFDAATYMSIHKIADSTWPF